MTRQKIPAKAIKSGMTTSALVAISLTIAALASFSGNGIQVEAGGVEVTVKASMGSGLQVVFAAV
ncbi:MAG: hypothetical protein L3J02_01310 [Henriciella sp.]|nr:hypothetical protein [Henriciella sp.]